MGELRQIFDRITEHHSMPLRIGSRCESTVYYRVEDLAGRRFWIYREGLAGDGRGGVPAWYLHGLFG
jgi:hypothetical protein